MATGDCEDQEATGNKSWGSYEGAPKIIVNFENATHVAICHFQRGFNWRGMAWCSYDIFNQT